MAVKSSGTLGLVSDIVAEFGGTSPYALTDYYRGGGLVPDSSANSGVPTSGTIAITDFYGAENVTYQAVGPGLTSSDEEGFTPHAVLYYDADGGVRKFTESSGFGTTADAGEWSSAHPGETGGASYAVRVRHVSGTDTYAVGDGLNTWVSLGSNRSWRFNGPTSGFNVEVGGYEVDLSLDGGSTVHDTDPFTVSLTNNGPLIG